MPMKRTNFRVFDILKPELNKQIFVFPNCNCLNECLIGGFRVKIKERRPLQRKQYIIRIRYGTIKS